MGSLKAKLHTAFIIVCFISVIKCSKSTNDNGNAPTTDPSTKYTLKATVSPTNGGSVKVSYEVSNQGFSTDFQNTFSITENSGTSFSFSATPDPGYTFVGWEGDSTDKNNSITITLDKDINITALFSKVTPDPSLQTTEQQKVALEIWNIFDRHYPLMHRKNINWKSVLDSFYPNMTASTTDQDLVRIFTSIMNTIIKDGHTSITYNGSSFGYSEPVHPHISNMIYNSNDIVVSFDPNSTSQNSSYILYGSLASNPDIGYIKSLTFEPTNEDDAEFTVYKTHVDQALEALKNKKGIIVDVRENGGGQQQYAYYLSGRFFSLNNQPILRARYKTKTGDTEASLSDWVLGNNSFDGYPDPRAEGGTIASTYPDYETVSKSGAFQFTKKVALLTSRSTASSGEFFTVAMKSQPHVKTIGNTTFGIYAGSEIIKLNAGNNKWSIRVSVHDIEVMYGGSFKSLEGIGIVPDQLLLPTLDEASSGRDIHIEAAVTYINN